MLLSTVLWDLRRAMLSCSTMTNRTVTASVTTHSHCSRTRCSTRHQAITRKMSDPYPLSITALTDVMTDVSQQMLAPVRAKGLAELSFGHKDSTSWELEGRHNALQAQCTHRAVPFCTYTLPAGQSFLMNVRARDGVFWNVAEDLEIFNPIYDAEFYQQPLSIETGGSVVE
mmetsp:Transcript_951/g.1912  ORF Transcript_951/g.1912 Transcript_951/m.1912 type:complete len:171 (+) Transcript_951:2199-2711(+)